MENPLQILSSAAELVSTASTKLRVKIFHEELLPLLQSPGLASGDITSLFVDIIFHTLFIYDDRASQKAVDDVIIKALGEVPFMKHFAAALVQTAEKQLKARSSFGCYRLLKWSCLLLRWSQFTTISKNAISRIVALQASLLHVLLQGSFRVRRASKHICYHLFSELADEYEIYVQELNDLRLSHGDCAELIWLLLDYSRTVPPLFEKHRPVFLDFYVKVILSAREKPPKALSEAFCPLFTLMRHEEFRTVILPTSVKMLKRNPELVLESVGILLRSVNLDLSKYAVELLSGVQQQLRHSDEGRRCEALAIIGSLSQKSSDPDVFLSMFNVIKAVIGGSEGKLSFPYQRLGMFNALQQLSGAELGKAVHGLSSSICGYLLLCYRDDGSEEVKLSILSALASWVEKSAESVRPDTITFFTAGLKEKETLRRGHLRCLRVICKNSDVLTGLLPLLDPLIQMVKNGFTKVTQRLEAIYALVLVAKIVTADTRAEETVMKEKMWHLISQSDSSAISTSLASKLSLEDCLACVDLVEVLLVDHLSRVKEALPVKSLLQLILYLLCHPSWNVRKVASDAVKRILSGTPQLSDNLLLEFRDWLSVLGVRMYLSYASDAETMDTQVPSIPSPEVLVKALLVISSTSLARDTSISTRLIFCSHHPCITRGARRNVVWKRLQRTLHRHGHDVISIVASESRTTCEVLFGSRGLLSSNSLEQRAALSTLSTLMSLIPKDIFLEFEKLLKNLPERGLHDALSENDVKIFYTSEGMLSTEQGVYVAETLTTNGTKENVKSSQPGRKDPNKRDATSMGRKDSMKATKRNVVGDKGKTPKEEARELQLKEEASVREKVMVVQKILSVFLGALGEMAIANPVFTHGQLPSLVAFVNPLLNSPIVSDVAFETMLKLARCIAPPLDQWAPEIAAAYRIITTQQVLVLKEALLKVEVEVKQERSMGVFQRIVAGLVVSCNTGPLPADSFTFIFPILEQILLYPKKTNLHDDVLGIISMHLDPVLPLPRLRMISVLYHALSVVPAYQVSIGPMLNELCLGLKQDEVAQALCGVYAKDVHVRLACLNAVKCIPSVVGRSLSQDVDVATSIWIALHDTEKLIAESAEDVWDRYGFDFGTNYSGLYRALSHVNYSVRAAAAEALAAAIDENPETTQETLSNLFSLYIRDISTGGDSVDTRWIGRQGIALALHSAADVLRTKDLPVVMTFLISRALADSNMDVRGRMINAGIMIIDKHGKDNVALLFPIFENYLNKKASDEEKYDLVREGVVIFTGALAKHLSRDDPKVHTVVEKLLEVLNTPSEAVQRAVSDCLSPLMPSKQEDGQELVSRLLNHLMHSEKYGERRGAAFGLAGVTKGFGISSLKKYGIMAILRDGLEDRNSAKSREGALLGFECLCEKLGRLFEPYVIQMLPLLLVSFSDPVVAVREAAECAARAMMSQLSGQGVKLVLPSLLMGLEDKAWRTKQSSVQLLGAMAYCAPQQLSQCLPKIVPKLTEVLTDTHPKVQSAGQMALEQVGSVIRNPEISALVPTLLMGLTDPNEHTKHSLDILLQTTFINSIDAPSLALLVPIVHRGLRERSADTKKKAAQIVGNMCSLVTEPKDMIPYIGLLLPEVKKVLVDPIPEVRSVAARAIGSLIKGMGEEHFPDLVPWLLETLKSDSSNVERSGAAQGLSEVLAALGKEYFESILPDIIRNCSHQRASVRDGHLTLFKYLPRSLGAIFQNYLQQVLPAILDGLADENESVRDAALSAGHVLVEHYATTSLPLLLPAVEDGIFSDNWRIRQSSVELLGDLLFKVAGTSGKAILEGGSDDEGASTEAQGRAIIDVLGKDKRNEVLAAVYMVRTDVSLSVRQAALHVWKTIVANTPKTLKEIMPVLMNTLISSLASSSSERRQVAGRSLGELVRKLGERVLPLIIPILSQGLKDADPSRRQGVCIGLSEVMASAGKQQLVNFMEELIPTIRAALCDSTLEVREAAGTAFSTLYKSAGMLAIDEIVPTLLHALEDDDTSDTALDGLKQILSVRTAAVLPHILPKLVNLPLSAFNAHALGALAEVAGPGLNFHLGTILPALLSGMGDDDEEVQGLAKRAAETVVMVIDEDGIDPLISELLKGVGDSQASMRTGCAYLIGYLFKNSKLYLVDEAPNMISTLIVLLSDSDSLTVECAWEALGRVVGSLPKEVLPSHIKLVRDAISTARDKERRKRKGGPVLIPGLCLPKALQPLLPIFLQGLISGSADLREQAAQGLGELIDVTGEKSLKEFVIPITGPLIRIIGDRFPWQVKSAILTTLVIIISKGGIALKPFLPQLQTTFIKCLQDSTRTVRSTAALALGKLSALSTRLDPLVNDLLSTLQASDGGVREAVLSALKGVFKHAGKSVSSAFRSRVHTLLKDLIQLDDDHVRNSAGRVLGIISQYMEDGELLELLQTLTELASTQNWYVRHGCIIAFASMFMHCPSAVCHSAAFPSVVDCLREALKDDKFPIRETATKALGRLLVYQAQEEPSGPLELVPLLISALQDDSSEVRRRALSGLKSTVKANVFAVTPSLSAMGPVLGLCLKDGSTPVRLAAERCILHLFQLTKGGENVQAAQKFMTGLDARRISKLPEHSDESGDSEEDVPIS
ncbi:protein ILITYHIA [Amborella trichopoda]|uniref:protein ILITYHIA n=1 Tax=Amborella trichopoda TaxID=13333 RepID=UPI0009BE4716|nr:protein ILITYHIA [Amborella trichopoda]|eukprot:XP_020529182.1 protein ILITYHIA [Amborella trichopoda]